MQCSKIKFMQKNVQKLFDLSIHTVQRSEFAQKGVLYFFYVSFCPSVTTIVAKHDLQLTEISIILSLVFWKNL